MNLDTEIKKIHEKLFTDNDPREANELCNVLLGGKSNSSQNAFLNIYKSICLLKLYFGSKIWENKRTLLNIFKYLNKGSLIGELSSDEKILGFVHFRYAVLYYHLQNYKIADNHLNISKNIYNFTEKIEPSLLFWEYNIQLHLNKPEKEDISKPIVNLDILDDELDDLQEDTIKLDTKNRNSKQQQTETARNKAPMESNKTEQKPEENIPTPTLPQQKFRVDFYQTPKTIVITLFTNKPPKTKEDLTCVISQNQSLTLSYPNPDPNVGNSEFQYNLNLAFKVDSKVEKIFVNTKKIEITLNKLKVGHTWKTLEYKENQLDPSISASALPHKTNDTIKSPYTSKVDWNKFATDISEEDVSQNNDLNTDADTNEGGVESFFQQLYKDADPDTKRAMMKSFVESSGTSLSTDWEDVKDRKVETVAPDGTEPKKW